MNFHFSTICLLGCWNNDIILNETHTNFETRPFKFKRHYNYSNASELIPSSFIFSNGILYGSWKPSSIYILFEYVGTASFICSFNSNPLIDLVGDEI